MITKERFSRLYADDVLKKEYDQIIREVDARFGEVVLLLFPDIKKKGGWFVYGNYDYDSEDDAGNFDPDQYSEYMEVGGSYKIEKDHPLGNGCGYIDAIPTRYLWTSDEEILEEINQKIEQIKKENEAKKTQAQIKKEEQKKYKDQIIQSIKSKLTPEELKQVVFK